MAGGAGPQRPGKQGPKRTPQRKAFGPGRGTREKRDMAIYGVALLAICTLLGALLGDILGVGLGVKTNVGGVGIAMILLMAARVWLMRKGVLTHGLKLGIEFWAALYIPIVVAMAAIQNVVAAVSGGPVMLIAGGGGVVVCFSATAFLIRFSLPPAPRLNSAQGGHAARGLFVTSKYTV